MAKILKHGNGWRLGWDPEADEFKGLVGGDEWAIELTEAELEDFCRLLLKLAQTMKEMAGELMDEEKIACEIESDRLWIEAEGYADAFSLRFILNGGRRCEAGWPSEVVPDLVQAAAVLKVF